MAEIALAASAIVLSPLLQTFFERMMSSEFVHFLRGQTLDDGLLMRLKVKLESVIVVVEDAEGKQFTKPAVKKWLDRVKHAVYDAEDILDEIATQELRLKLEAEFGTPSENIWNVIATFPSQVWPTISTSSSIKEVEREIEKLLERLEFLLEEKENLGLRADVGGQSLERLPTTSLVDESSTFGRHDEKDAIIKSLLSDGASRNGMGVIAIVGMGGIGKTTLAQLIYNNDLLKEHFDLKAWVYVSNEFNMLKLTKTILGEVGLHADDTDNLNQLQNNLKERLNGKKILLVLDDVWNITHAQWDLLIIPFKSSRAQEIRVLITTRDEKVAVMFASKTHRINELPKEDCWLLFEKYAFQNLKPDARQECKDLGIQILEKCKGLPLAIKAIGALLQSKSNVKEWGDVLRSELWDLLMEEIDILPALGLSYKCLSPLLRRCFAYCSMFPKGYAFEKDAVVLLWMAEDFLPQLPNKTMEEVGDICFLALVSRSLFQRSNIHDRYIMHDLVSDLAKFISEQFTLCHENSCSREIGSNTRHLLVYSQELDSENFKAIHRAERLRTIVDLNSFFMPKIPTLGKGTKFSLPMIRCLRVLILSHDGVLTGLLDLIGELILLRYLDLSQTNIEKLPDSICKLCNLQILNLSCCKDLAALPRDMHKLISLQRLDLSCCFRLAALPRDMHKLINLQILNLSDCWDLCELPRDMHKLSNLQILNLSGCWELCELPRDMHKLSNLRHLNIAGTRIRETPINLGELKCLQTLSTFIVSKRNGSGIEELGKLTNLRGLLSVLELQNVESPTDAKGAKYLKDKKNLEELVLQWKVDTNASVSRNCVLDSLEPHLSLKSLRIDGYGGTSFPKWVGDALFSNIASLYLDNCKFCCSLPPLGQLPSLQELGIYGLDGVVKVGSEFYGIGSSSLKPFGALKFLTFSDMIGWEEWFSFEGEAFSKLEKLDISKCPKLTRGLPTHLPSLAELFIDDCPRLVASLPGASSLCSVRLSNCNTVLFNESPTGIHELSIKRCSKLGYCGSLKSFPLFSKLRQLRILDCGDLESLTVGEQHEHDLLLSEIEIDRCPNFAYFPQGGLRAPNLTELEIEDCRSLRSLPEKMDILLPSLEELHIKDCPQVESFPEGGLPSNLNKIFILNCNKLFASRIRWGLQNLPCVRSFTIGDKSEDVESFPEEGLLPASLTYLFIQGFPNLKSLDKKGLQHITALEELHFWKCPKLECMPEDWLPASLSTLNIYKCPLLEKEWERKEGEEWRKIAHVRNKYINGRWIP